jgi:Spy/CpxP family protein refolding chaperone
MLRAENARADKAEARAKAAEALLTPEQRAKLGK